ncbi:glycosyltransferase [Paludisphaera soli]|uniref:glycosyltransferase n=1 Tax=Paludisphaera soli TaxID=2712865 RepID=UPI0013E9E9BD|nr:glycosyltransferase [Paludisphaera soli]
MDVSQYLSPASFWTPDHAFDPIAHAQFSPMIFWTVDAARPRRVAQLGFREPAVYFSMCEAVRRLGLDARCVALEPERDDSSSSAFLEASIQRVRDAHDRRYSSFSKLLRHHAVGVEAFDDRSLDLVHPSDGADLESFLEDFDRWRAKLSDRAVLILSRTCVQGRRFGSHAAFRDLAERHPSFEFTHGEGLGLVALGPNPPERLKGLFDADAVPGRRNEIRSVYARLGRSLADRMAIESEGLDADSAILELGGGDADADGGGSTPDWSSPPRTNTVEEALALREEVHVLREELAILEERHRAISIEHANQGREIPGLRQHLAHYQYHHAAAMAQLEVLRRSTASRWIERCRGVKTRFFPETRLHGRCVALSIRFLRVAVSEGPRPALSRASRRLFRKVGKSLGVQVEPAAKAELAAPVATPTAPPRFEDLPWSKPRVDSDDAASRVQASFKVLLVSHSACRTGAPFSLLRLCEELSRVPGIECWVVLKTGGDLVAEFARRAPTLVLAKVVEAGIASWAAAPSVIAERFREYARNGAAVCNTMAVSEFHEAFEAADVPVLSWIHELPTFIEILGGVEAIERIKAASRRTIVPAEVVRNALINRFDVGADRIQTVRYGLDAKTRGLSREEMRESVRAELNLPDDARIILGCGTIDLRKGADLFVQAARTVLSDPSTADLAERTYFVWFGHVVLPDFFQWLRHDVEASGFADRILFAGVRGDLSPYFLAADVFALTSREDPCPFANLEAMESALPVVAFQGSGGAPEVLDGGGVAVPYLDVPAMARAIRELLNDDDARSTMGRRGRTVVRSLFTWPRFMDEFLTILRADYGYSPAPSLKVSVIVPNYRHAPFLETRLRSLFEQTVRPHEIIFLDDASPDDSVEVARRLAPESPVPMRIIVNEENSGSTFRQWMKGMDLATGDLIWFAESDDSCRPQFLERLIPEFHDPEVILAYCQSGLIGPNDERWAADFLGHTDDLDVARWRKAYRAEAAEEAEVALSQKNTVPNASAVLFRKPERLDFADELAGMRFAGDWLFYALMIRGGKIAFVPESLNDYRRHEQTVSFQSIKADTHAEETLHVKRRIFETFDVSLNAMARSLGQTLFEYELMTERFALKRPSLMNNPRTGRPLGEIRELFRRKLDATGELKILLVVDGSESGLAATATIDLADELARDHRVFLCAAAPGEAGLALQERLSDRVVLLEGTLGTTPWSASEAPEGSIAGRVRVTVLQELIRFHEIDVVHSLNPSGDRLVAQINADLNLPWFVHHEAGCSSPELRPARTKELISGVFHQTPVAPALDEHWAELASRRWLLLFPGLKNDDTRVEKTGPIVKRQGEFLVYLVPGGAGSSRASRDAMTAVRILNRLPAVERGGRRVRLVLTEPGADPRDSAIAASADRDLRCLLGQCDAALAPAGELSAETSIHVAAALASHLPVIAPNRGPIHDMLTLDGCTAGIAPKANEHTGLDVHRMVAAMLRYLRQADLHADHVCRARQLFEARFDVRHAAHVCVEAYFHARDFLVFPREGLPTTSAPERTSCASRESA